MTVTCRICNQEIPVSATEEQIAAWRAGTLIQKAMPDVPAEERELNNPFDYRRLCISCHRKFDFRTKGTKPGRKEIHERAIALRGDRRSGFGGGTCL